MVLPLERPILAGDPLRTPATADYGLRPARSRASTTWHAARAYIPSNPLGSHEESPHRHCSCGPRVPCEYRAPNSVPGPQSLPEFFTLIAVPDIHYYTIYGAITTNSIYWDTYAKPWIRAHYADSTWNAVSISGLGDMISECNTVGPIRGGRRWLRTGNRFTTLATRRPSSPATTIAAVPRRWGSVLARLHCSHARQYWLDVAFDAFFPTFKPYTVVRGMQYKRLDIATAIGTIKLGISAAVYAPSGNDLCNSEKHR